MQPAGQHLEHTVAEEVARVAEEAAHVAEEAAHRQHHQTVERGHLHQVHFCSKTRNHDPQQWCSAAAVAAAVLLRSKYEMALRACLSSH